MTTTSGSCSRTAGTASCPAPTEATISMSSRRSSRSSSASRKTWLSSTSRTRIGPATRRKLLRCEEERIVRLSAVLDVELERGMPLMEPLDEADDVRLLVPDEQRQNVVRLGEQPFRNGGSDLVEIRAVRDNLSLSEAEVAPLPDRQPVQGDVARGDRDFAGRDAGGGLAHLGR